MTQVNIHPGAEQAASEKSIVPRCCRSRSGRDNGTTNPGAAAANACLVCPQQVEWKWSSFNELSASTLYSALRLRQNIFIVEQNVPYFDIDGRDPDSMHLLGLLNGELVAYLRALPCGLFEPGYVSFGRVVVHENMRGLGLGRKLVEQCLNRFAHEPESAPVKISSQLYLKNFYETFDFVPIGEPYIEDKIEHIAMIKNWIF